MPKAVVCRELGPPERLRLETFASVPLAPGQVRVAIRAAGINFPDILMAAGEYQLKPELPFTPGVEAAGEVTEVDGVAGVAVGDRVIVKMRHGAYADEAVVTPSQLTPMPSTFDFAEGATFLAGARHGVSRADRSRPAQTGRSAAGAWRRRRRRARRGRDGQDAGGDRDRGGVDRKRSSAVAQAKGADHLVLYAREPFREAVKRITDGRGVDVVFDPVGGDVFEESMRCIAWGARLLVIGFTGGIGLARTNLLLIKGASVLGVRAGEAVRRNPAAGAARIKTLLEWAEAGKIRPHVSHRLPLEDYAQAMRLLIDRKAIGRVALTMG